jgi:hypothetical protein
MADQNENNPRNSQSSLFKRLTRLFSGPIATRRSRQIQSQAGTAPDKYTFRTSTGKEFKKKEYYNPFQPMQYKNIATMDRGLRYSDFEEMEYTPEIASALDIYADEITTSSDLNPIVGVDCENQEIKQIVTTFLYKVLNIESNLFGWARSMCKYGDYYLYMDIDDEVGVTNVIPLPVREIEREEGKDPTNPNYVQYFWNGASSEGVTFENWQVAHFRVMGNDKYVPYGTSTLEPARRIWRQLTLVEDAMMAYRVVRSPERRVFYIDVGNIPPQDVEQYIEQVKTQMKRNQILDADTGRVDLRYNPMSIDEDYYIPIRAGQSSRIETLAAGQLTNAIDDVQYLRDKLFSALKVPKAYLAQSDAMEDKSTLAQKDIRFARTIQRLQRVILSELEKMVIVHLYTLGFRDDDLVGFRLSLNNPSKIAELQELEHMRTKFEIAGAATEGYFSKHWVYRHIFKLDEQEIERVNEERYADAKITAIIEKSAELAVADYEAAGSPAGEGEEGEGGDDFGGDLGGEGDLGGGDDLGGDDLGGEEEGGEEGPLLAEPGKRDDGGYLTPGAKGKVYHPATLDMRKGGGPRQRNMAATAGQQTASPSRRNIFKGYNDMRRLGVGISESQIEEEKLLFETKRDISKLIEQLGSKNDNQT